MSQRSVSDVNYERIEVEHSKPKRRVALFAAIVMVMGVMVVVASTFSIDSEDAMSETIMDVTTINATTEPWINWMKTIQYNSTREYYFAPRTRDELLEVVAQAAADNKKLRVSGQRHSIPPVVITENSDETYVVDMYCYADLGENGDERLTLDVDNLRVTVNTGVREDELDQFLTSNNLAMKTSTAGGFFSLGGITSIDAHGSTLGEGIVAESVVSFNMVTADGSTLTIDESDTFVYNNKTWNSLQFARVNLGALGVVTSVVIDVKRRPYANSLVGGNRTITFEDKDALITYLKNSTASYDRVEYYFSSYDLTLLELYLNDFGDDVDEKIPNKQYTTAESSPATCVLPTDFGAPYVASEAAAEAEGHYASNNYSVEAAVDNTNVYIYEQAGMYDAAVSDFQDLWITESSRAIPMSYMVEVNLENGWDKIWDFINVGRKDAEEDGNWHNPGPIEFRFVTGGDTAMSGAYSSSGSTILSIETYFFPLYSQEGSDVWEMNAESLAALASRERQYVAMGGLPHNGKLFGLYDPTDPDTSSVSKAPFNPKFIADLRLRRGERVEAFNAFRKTVDPGDMFVNDYIVTLVQG